MYALYDKIRNKRSTRYCFRDQISLFGCRSGYIPWLLKQELTFDSTQPLKWHVNVERGLQNMRQDSRTLIIDLKPNSTEPNLSLYEVLDVWGYSDSGWTPILLHLQGLFVDENPKRFDRNRFVRRLEQIDHPIFSMMYLGGTVKNGQLKGRWTTPGPSPTNSVLLWPDAFRYFQQQAQSVMNE